MFGDSAKTPTLEKPGVIPPPSLVKKPRKSKKDKSPKVDNDQVSESNKGFFW